VREVVRVVDKKKPAFWAGFLKSIRGLSRSYSYGRIT
jgi:hypothetical protein